MRVDILKKLEELEARLAKLEGHKASPKPKPEPKEPE